MTRDRTCFLVVLIVLGVNAFDRRVDDSVLMRVKRQAVRQGRCPNGGEYIGVGCYFSAQCTPWYSGVSTCINGCCCTVPSPQPQPNVGYCSNGQVSSIRCSAAGQCGPGSTCMNGLCCPTTGQESLYACGGDRAAAACSNGRCNQGFACVPSNFCCQCPVGQQGGFCGNGQPCQPGFHCQINGYCCAMCPDNQTPIGACRGGFCPGGRQCMPGNICC